VGTIEHTFTATDGGTATLGVPLPSAGAQTITVADEATAALSGSFTVTAVAQGDVDNANFVESLYWDLLGRAADDAGLQGWLAAMDGGTSRAQVAQSVEGSDEYHMAAVTTLYQNLLRRAPDAAGLSGFVSAMHNGLSLDDVAVALMSSAEYYQVRGGGTDAGFVNALYQDALNRGADAGGAAYFGGLLAGGDSRADVVQKVMMSTEAEQVAVNDAYQTFLRRDADAAGLGSWVAKKQHGLTTDQMFVALLSSDEYFANAAG
jgi:hypothetical protein